MPSIHMSFKSTDTDEMTLFEYLQALGKKNRSELIKLLSKMAVERYGCLFNQNSAKSLLEIIRREGVPPSSPQLLQHGMVQVQASPFTGKKPGKKRGPKPKKKDAAVKEPKYRKTKDENLPPASAEQGRDPKVPAGEGGNRDFYKKMSSFLEDAIYNT